MTNEELGLKLTEVDQRGKSNTHRIEEVEKRQDNLDSLVTSVAVMATKQETIEKDVTEIKNNVKTLTEKPGKRWDAIVDRIIWAAVAIAVGYLLARLGIK